MHINLDELNERIKKTILEPKAKELYSSLLDNIEHWFYDDIEENFKIWNEDKAIQIVYDFLSGNDRFLVDRIGAERSKEFQERASHILKDKIINELRKENESLRNFLNNHVEHAIYRRPTARTKNDAR